MILLEGNDFIVSGFYLEGSFTLKNEKEMIRSCKRKLTVILLKLYFAVKLLMLFTMKLTIIFCLTFKRLENATLTNFYTKRHILKVLPMFSDPMELILG